MADEYTEANFKVLRDCQHIRARPGMYIGDTGRSGLTYLVMLLAEWALNRLEPSAGVIEISTTSDDTVVIRTNAPPLPTDETLVALATQIHSPGPRQRVRTGLHGLELQAPCALSTRFGIDVHADGVQWRQSFSRGEPVGGIVRIGPTTHTGNTFTFRPDPEIFTQTIAVPIERVCQRLHELAAFYPGLRFTLNGETIYHPDGLVALFDAETDGFDLIQGAPIQGSIETEEGRAQLIFWWYDGPPRLVSFANGSRTLNGEHVRGFRTALTRVLGQRPSVQAAQRGQVSLGEVVQSDLVAVISVEVADPFYGGPTRDNLSNTEAFRLLDALTARLLDEQSMELHAVEAHVVLNIEADLQDAHLRATRRDPKRREW
jgi:DNA gyrase/topoisomerase IV subunit B